jgi:hypothetical protein
MIGALIEFLSFPVMIWIENEEYEKIWTICVEEDIFIGTQGGSITQYRYFPRFLWEEVLEEAHLHAFNDCNFIQNVSQAIWEISCRGLQWEVIQRGRLPMFSLTDRISTNNSEL